MRELLNSTKANERFSIVTALKSCVPKSLLREMIRQALNDKSARVREMAASRADSLELEELVPDLQSRLALEEHPRVKKTLEFSVAMLRDGYFFRWRADGTPTVTIRTKRGWEIPRITERDIEAGRLKSIIARAKAKAAKERY